MFQRPAKAASRSDHASSNDRRSSCHSYRSVCSQVVWSLLPEACRASKGRFLVTRRGEGHPFGRPHLRLLRAICRLRAWKNEGGPTSGY